MIDRDLRRCLGQMIRGVQVLGAAADQLADGQYFSDPGRRFRYVAKEHGGDHDLFFARVVGVREGWLKEPSLRYSSLHRWRATGAPAREKGISVRHALLARLGEGG